MGRSSRARSRSSRLSSSRAAASTKVDALPVFDENDVEVFLRYESKGGKPIDRDFSHPVVIAPVRLTNLLARIEVRKGRQARAQPAIATDLLYPIGEGIARALAKADPSQQVVVMAKQRKRSMGIFTQDYLTSLVVWNLDDKLFVKLGHLDWALPKDPQGRSSPSRRTPTSSASSARCRATASPPKASSSSPRTGATRSSRTRARSRPARRTGRAPHRADGQRRGSRRFRAEPATGAAVPPQGVSPEGLRALADLEESRRRGELTEADYQAKRRAILAGSMPAAPTPTSNPAPRRRRPPADEALSVLARSAALLARV